MIAGAITFPFALIGARPWLILGCLLLALLLAVGLDLVAARMGAFAASESQPPAQHAVTLVLYYLARAAVLSFPSAVTLVAALIQLEMRERGRGPSLADGFRVAWLNVAYVLLVVGAAERHLDARHAGGASRAGVTGRPR